MEDNLQNAPGEWIQGGKFALSIKERFPTSLHSVGSIHLEALNALDSENLKESLELQLVCP